MQVTFQVSFGVAVFASLRSRVRRTLARSDGEVNKKSGETLCDSY